MNGEYRKLYTGEWAANTRSGYGTQYYSDVEYYEGQWGDDRRDGWGRMYYADGSVYEGLWRRDRREGQGLYKLPNQNRYEGLWLADKKHGDGKFYYLDSGQLFEGTWVDDVARCGAMRDLQRESAPAPTQYAIRTLELADPAGVLAAAREAALAAHTNTNTQPQTHKA